MWYYQKDKERRGPVAEPAIVALFKEGTINAKTKVFDTRKRGWQAFGDTKLYQNTVKARRNRRYDICKVRTQVFRGVAMSMIVLLCYKIFLLFQTSIYHPFDATTIFDIQNMQGLLKYNENSLLLQIVTMMQIGVLLGLFITLAAWTSAVVKAVKSVSSRFYVSSNMAILWCLLPVVNIVSIPEILKRVYRTLEFTIRGKRNIVSLIFLRTLMFIWFAVWGAFIFNRWGVSISSDSELIHGIYRFRIFNCALQILLLIAVMIFITKILSMIKSKTAGKNVN